MHTTYVTHQHSSKGKGSLDYSFAASYEFLKTDQDEDFVSEVLVFGEGSFNTREFKERFLNIQGVGIMIGYIDPDQIRPYLEENAQTRPILQAKLRRATSVLWWVTTREYVVLYFFAIFDHIFTIFMIFLFYIPVQYYSIVLQRVVHNQLKEMNRSIW